MSEHVFWSGNYAKAQGIHHAIANLAGEDTLPPLTRIRLAIARHCHHWSNADAERGLQAVREGIEIAEAAGIDSYRSLHSGVAFRYCMLLGRYDEARAYVGAMADGREAVEDRMRHHVCSAWLELETGDAAMANGHALEAFRLADHASAPCAHALTLIALAQTRFALGKPAEARTTIDWALAIARDSGSACWVFNSLVIKAYLACMEARQGALSHTALDDVRAAMNMGRAHGFVYFNFYRPCVIRTLCAAALRHGIEVDYARRLIQVHGLSADPHGGAEENWPWPVMIYALRPFEILRDGKPMRFPAKAQAKPVALLKALVAFGGERVSEALLTQILWPDAEGDRAHWVFRVTLRRLRQLLDTDGDGKTIELSDGQISLNPALVWTDVRAFAEAREALETCLRDAEHGRSGSPALRDAAVTQALDRLFGLYRAHFLSHENAHEEVFLPAREKLRSHFRRAVRDAAHYWEERDDWARATDCYLRGVEIDPFAEELYCGLMQAYCQQGLVADAMRTYQRCAEVLTTVLNLKPGKRIQELLGTLRAQHGTEVRAGGAGLMAGIG
jgi:DNA-binding SARP family transcriptional activator